ncbi:MAG: hypothetical protein II903_09410 [Spirochaetales bacterium]|nr:hypothetical protein [Spirochaetales bacterium]
MKKYLFPRVFLAPDDGGAGGGEGEKDPKDIELENLKAQLDAEKQKTAEAEKKLKDAEDAKLTEDERNAAAAKAEKDKTTAKIKELQAKALGIDPKYVSLIQGETAEEIEKNATLLSDMLKENSEAVEKRVKESVAKTGAPGASMDSDEEMDSKDYYKSIYPNNKG